MLVKFTCLRRKADKQLGTSFVQHTTQNRSFSQGLVIRL